MNTIVPQTTDTATDVADTAVELEYAAVAGKKHAIFKIIASYSATPTGGELTVERDGVVVMTVQVPDTLLVLDFSPALSCEINEELVIGLSAGGALVVGSVTALHKTIP